MTTTEEKQTEDRADAHDRAVQRILLGQKRRDRPIRWRGEGNRVLAEICNQRGFHRVVWSQETRTYFCGLCGDLSG